MDVERDTTLRSMAIDVVFSLPELSRASKVDYIIHNLEHRGWFPLVEEEVNKALDEAEKTF